MRLSVNYVRRGKLKKYGIGFKVFIVIISFIELLWFFSRIKEAVLM